MKYSPCPWIAKFEEAFRIKDIKGNTVCIMTHLTKTGRREPSEVEANAKLIAAAPKLLQALADIQECCSGYVGTGPLKTINEIAQTAINKVEGR